MSKKCARSTTSMGVTVTGKVPSAFIDTGPGSTTHRQAFPECLGQLLGRCGVEAADRRKGLSGCTYWSLRGDSNS